MLGPADEDPGSEAVESPHEVPHAFAVSDCRDRMVAQAAVVRRRFWRRLLPGVGITAAMVSSVIAGVGSSAAVVAIGFGVLTLREGLTFRRNLARLRELEDELQELRDMGEARE